jgi:hypothetical protein
MSGWQPSRPSRPRPPWDTQGQPTLPAEGTWYGAAQGPRVVIKPQGTPARGGRPPGSPEPPRRKNRALIVAGTTIGVVVLAGAGFVAFKLVHGGGSQPASAISTAVPVPSQNATSPAATPSATATATTTASATATAGATTVTYVLSDPGTAGGYSQVSPVAATVQAIGTAGATELMTAVETGGGKTTSNVSSEYLIAGDQVLGYAGYNGTFDPQSVLKDFQAGATAVTSEPAGPHGGVLACGQVAVPSPATTGEACVWATTSTVGMVEFYGDNGGALEAVTPSKAGQDTLAFRDDVEAAKH